MTAPTPISRANNLLPIGDNFLFIESSGVNCVPNVFCNFERRDIIPFSTGSNRNKLLRKQVLGQI